MPTYPESKWRELGIQMVKASGVSEEEAETVTDVLVTGSQEQNVSFPTI